MVDDPRPGTTFVSFGCVDNCWCVYVWVFLRRGAQGRKWLPDAALPQQTPRWLRVARVTDGLSTPFDSHDSERRHAA